MMRYQFLTLGVLFAPAVLGGRLYLAKETSNDFLGKNVRYRRSLNNGKWVMGDGYKGKPRTKTVEEVVEENSGTGETEESCLDSHDTAVKCENVNCFNCSKVRLKTLKRGDFIHSAYNQCTKVVLINKNHSKLHSKPPRYTQIGSKNNTVNLTPGHKLIINGEEIQAKYAQEGDQLIGADDIGMIEQIKHDEEGGEYISVYTQNGTITVNNIGVSSFAYKSSTNFQKFAIQIIDFAISGLEKKRGSKLSEEELENYWNRYVNDFYRNNDFSVETDKIVTIAEMILENEKLNKNAASTNL